MKKKTTTCQVGADKSKRKAIKSGTTTWVLKPNQKGNSKINDNINKSIDNWILHHPQVVQSPILNNSLKVNIDVHTTLKLVKKLLLKILFQELYNSLVSDPLYGGLKEARYVENNTIISYSTFCSLLPPQLKNIIKIQGYMWL